MSKYLVGIDLGTTHTVVAYCALGKRSTRPAIQLLKIEQLVASGEVGQHTLLPSIRYHVAPGQLEATAMQLPWPAAEENVVTGKFARTLGAQVPGRLVASAKSWLSHPQVDRQAAILPWGAAPEVPKISPVAASSSYLAHVRACWDRQFPAHPLAQQEIVLTIPASFDEGARALTLAAAQMAGLPELRLVEEPQAAFYDWLYRHNKQLKQELAGSTQVLVVDVGGGTTDFSLISVELVDGEPQLTRTGVGNHLMLGGDNMDLALAHLVESRLNSGAASGKLSTGQLSQLIERCRQAKEQLLAPDAPEQVSVTLLGGGSKLIGGSRSTGLGREEVRQLIVDGFMPQVGLHEGARKSRSALLEFGLPYASDPAITRHLASFLQQHADRLPDTLLLNGGVFRGAALAERLQQTLNQWCPQPVRLLHNDNPDVAVARGAVAFALARHGLGPRIGGGAARSYYLQLERGKPGRAICILPRGTEPSQEITLPGREFALRVGQPVRFHLLSSNAGHDALGSIIDIDPETLTALPPLATVLHARHSKKKEIPVELQTMLTEVGTLEIHCRSLLESGAEPGVRTTDADGAQSDATGSAGSQSATGSATSQATASPTPSQSATADSAVPQPATSSTGIPAQRWRLEFQLRGETEEETAEPAIQDSAALPARLPEALALIERIFGKAASSQIRPGAKPAEGTPSSAAHGSPATAFQANAKNSAPGPVTVKEVKGLRTQLEQILGPRERWETPLLRHLFDALWQRARARRRSVEHERLWLNLAGFCLRPGFGYPLDEWRIEQLWPLFEQGVQFGKDSQVCSEWWTLWRRISGGLDLNAQLRLLDDFAVNLQGSAEDLRQRGPNAVDGSNDDMLRLGASLERIPAAWKAEIGNWLLARISPDQSSDSTSRHLWALSRLGARQAFHGTQHEVVDPDTVAQWLARLFEFDWRRNESAAFAGAHLARLTGDRARDLPDALRLQVVQKLQGAGAPANWVTMVREVVQLDEASKRRVLGEALPPGLKLLE